MGRQRQFYVVLIAVFFYMTALMGIAPTFSEFLVQRRCREMDADDCGGSDVTSSASNWYLWCMLCVNVPCFLSNSFLGAIADRYGRRPVLLLVYSFGVVWSGAIVLVNVCDLPIMVVLPFWVLTGITGGMGTVMSSSFSVIADLYTPEERGSKFAVMSGVAFSGGISGPMIGGQLIKPFGILWETAGEAKFQLAFIVFVSLFIVPPAVIVFFFKESIRAPPMERRVRCTDFFLNTFGALCMTVRHRSILVLLGCFTLLFTAVTGVYSIIPIYAHRSQFSLTASDIGWLLSLGSVMGCIGIFCILSPILESLERRYSRAADPMLAGVSLECHWSRHGPMLAGARIGALLSMLALLAYAVLPGNVAGSVFTPEAGFFVSNGLLGFSSIWDPCVRSLLSIAAEKEGAEQGATLGALAMAQSFVNIFAPIVFDGIYSMSASSVPSLCFYVGMGCGVTALLLLFVMPPKMTGSLGVAAA